VSGADSPDWNTALVSAVEPVPHTATVGRALRHILLAGGLGIVAALAGAPVVAASLFGGGTTFLIALTVVAAVISALAVALDRAVGPGRGGPGGSLLRGVTLGVLGSVAVVVSAFGAVRLGYASVLPVPLRFAAAALPFAALAGLQWRGVVRIVTAVVLVVTGAVVGVPRATAAVAENRADSIVTEVGTTAHPWVTEIDGLRGAAPQHTGSDYLWTPYLATDGSREPVVRLLLMPTIAPDGDPCGSEFYTPGGDFPVSACTQLPSGVWLRTAEQFWRQLITRVDGTWISAVATPDVPQRLLEEALRNARPMTDDEYEAWLDEVLPPPAGY
jgi:hypothetical protein